jgi:carbon monoxide dehydrogenase subunit G
MEFSGEYLLPVGQQRVWEALNDPVVLQASIAGCKQLDKLSDTEFSAVVTSKVGPISVTFRGAVELIDLDATNGYTLTGRVQGGAAGFARMTARISLEKTGDDETLLRYTAEAEIGGKLASVGSRLVQSVAKKSADDFFATFSRQLTGQLSSAGALPKALAAEEKTPLLAISGVTPFPAFPGGGGLGAPVPAWLVVFGTGLGAALGYCAALLLR